MITAKKKSQKKFEKIQKWRERSSVLKFLLQ